MSTSQYHRSGFRLVPLFVEMEIPSPVPAESFAPPVPAELTAKEKISPLSIVAVCSH
jgi:hypothetical protein